VIYFLILFRAHVDMLRQLNDLTKFHTKILNKTNIGKSSEELIAHWNRAILTINYSQG
jgi:hypothetical protein